MNREKAAKEFQKIVENEGGRFDNDDDEEEEEELERKSNLFKKILEVPREERDRIQRLQVIDRAAAAIAAARALLKDNPPPAKSLSDGPTGILESEGYGGMKQGICLLL